MKNMENEFGGLVHKVPRRKTPGTPKFFTVRPMEENKKILKKDQWDYISGIGILLYLVKYLHPDLANVTRDLSKTNDGVKPAAYKELLNIIIYVINTRTLGLRLNPQGISMTPVRLYVLAMVTMLETW